MEMTSVSSIIALVLGSSVFSAIVSGLFSNISARKEHQLVHITGERKEWRTSLRSAMMSMQENSMDPQKVRLQLDEISCRINPYGQLANKTELADKHIWEKIEKIEDEIDSSNTVNCVEMKQLQCYMRLLLKHDWERTKQEVIGNRLGTVAIILNVIGILFYAWGLVDMFKGQSGLLPILAYLVLGSFVALLPKVYISKKKDKARTFWVRLMIVIASLEVLLPLGIFVLSLSIKMPRYQFIVTTAILLAAFFIAWDSRNATMRIDNDYFESVQAVPSKFTPINHP